MKPRSATLPFALAALGLFASGCSGDARDDDSELSDDELATFDQNYTFRYELPPNDLFKAPFTQEFPFELEKHGMKLKAIIRPTAKVHVQSPVIEGHATVGKRRFASLLAGRPVPKILDAELKASSTYSTDLSVDVDLQWSNTNGMAWSNYPPPEQARNMADLLRDMDVKALANRALTLATGLGKKKVPLVAKDDTTREDLPVGVHYDVVVTCDIEELDGNLKGTFRTGATGTVVARAIYNVDGVEQRRFRRDPTHKFEIDTSDFKITPAPSFRFDGVTQHVKGSCSVQPVAVVKFAEDVGVRVRLDARSSFETRVEAASDMTPEWRLHATPELALWGEADITLPIIHRTLDKETLLFSKKFPEVNTTVGGAK